MCVWFGEPSSQKMHNTFIYTSQNLKRSFFLVTCMSQNPNNNFFPKTFCTTSLDEMIRKVLQMFISWFPSFNFLHNKVTYYVNKGKIVTTNNLKAHIQMQVLVFHMCFYANNFLHLSNGGESSSSRNGFFMSPLLGICPHEATLFPLLCLMPFLHVFVVLHLLSIICLIYLLATTLISIYPTIQSL